MAMTATLPSWLTPLAWFALALALASAAAISYDIYRRGHRQHSTAAELVWVGSGLYLGPFAVLLYRRHFASTRSPQNSTAGAAPTLTSTPAGSGAVLGLPGGTASAIAHLIGVPLVIASGLTIAGIDLWVMILVIAALAIVLLASFERLSGRSSPPSLISAVVAAVITVLAFDVGMGGWMLLLHFNEFMPPATDAAFWFLMQIGVVLGLLTGFPAVAWLARRSTSVTSPA